MNSRLIAEITNLTASLADKSLVEKSAILKQIAQLSCQCFGESAIEYAIAENDYASVLRNMGDLEQAMQHFNIAIAIFEKNNACNSENYATLLNNLAGVYRLQKAYDKAKALFLKSIAIYKQHCDSVLKISAYNNLGLLYQDLGQFEQAEELHQQCLVMLDKNIENNPVARATTLSNIANIYRQQQRFEQAIQYLQQALTIYQQSIGENNYLYLTVLNNFANLLFESKYYDRCLTILSQLDKYSRSVYGEQGEQYQKIQNNIAILTQKITNLSHTKNVTDLNGLKLSENFFKTACYPILKMLFTESILNRFAFGLVGSGSECYGVDDHYSRDHDFGSRIMVWLDNDDFLLYGDTIDRILSKIDKTKFGGITPQTTPLSEKLEGAFSISQFYLKYIGLERVPQTLKEWRVIPEQNLSVVTNGAVFLDKLGHFTHFRQGLLAFYPDDIVFKKIAANCMKIAQSGQYNLPRSLQRSDYIAAQQALMIFINAVAATVFLINRTYRPYYKLMHKIMDRLPVLGQETLQMFNQLLASDWQEKPQQIENYCALLANQLNQQGYSDTHQPFFIEQGMSVFQRIQDDDLKRSNPWLE